jgi:hypothetical protein
MTPFEMMRDAAATAGELAALLFLAPLPASAAGPAPAPMTAAAASSHASASAAAAINPANARLRDLHVSATSLDLRLLGMLADVRIVQTVHNDNGRPVDLGSHLPLAGEADRLSVQRDGLSVELLGDSEADCAEFDDPDAGRARTDDDEAIADLLRLMPGQQANIDVSATGVLQAAGGGYRVDLPATIAALDAQAMVVAQPTGSALLVIPPADASGVIRLTLRPADGPARDIALGPATPRSAYVVALPEASALAAVDDGAVEIEISDGTQVHWQTLPTRPHRAIAPVVAARD